MAPSFILNAFIALEHWLVVRRTDTSVSKTPILTTGTILAISGIVILTAWFYSWCARQPSSAFVSDQPIGCYPLQTKGFLNGHLAMAIEPHPGLLTLANPYDPSANAPYRAHDMSFYKGKYYLY
jgi:hypothetical protein